MTEYAGLSLQDIYRKKCEGMYCKVNSKFLASLPSKPDLFEVPTTIDLSTNFVGPKGLLAVMEVVRCCTGLVSLDLRDQQMSNESVTAVCAVVGRHPTIIKLNLSNNPLTISAGAALIELTKNNPVLEVIELQSTEIRGSMINAINSQLVRNKNQKGVAAVDGEGATAADINPNADAPSRVIDPSVVRSTLAGLPSTVNPILLDEDPVDALTSMCQRFDAAFVDTQFPPEAVSIQRVTTMDYGDCSWRRLPKLNLSRDGDGAITPAIYPTDDSLMMLPREMKPSFSWLFSCIGTALAPEKIRGLVSPKVANPYGVYSVRLHIDGKVRYVIVDDCFPVNTEGNLVFAPAAHSEYLWTSIVEKAVAKLHGGYQALDASITTRHPVEKTISCAATMCDLCGGIGISRDLHHEEFNSEEWWNTLVELNSSNSTYLVATSVKSEETATERLGIAPHHAYRVLHVRAINGFKLLHLSSPWSGRQWNGEWSDRSAMWEQYPHVAAALDIRNKGPNSFWIPYVKFLQLFEGVHLCRTFPDTQSRLLEGAWTAQTAGGAYFDPSWTTNPRYKLTLTERGSIFLNLSLPDERFAESDLDALAMHVFRCEQYPIRYDKETLVAKTSYVITNSVSFDGVFEAGDYWIVPSTYAAAKLGKYLLRVFSTSPFLLRHEHIMSYWQCHPEQIIEVKSSGEYQNGEDNPQLALKVEEGQQPAKIQVRMHTPDSEQLSIALFLVHNPRPGRVLGPINEEDIVSRTKFVISNTVTLEALLPGGDTNYVIVPCINPEGTNTRVVFSVWSSQAPVTLEHLPLWPRKSVVCEWGSSGPYQEATKNPQVELITPIPNQPFVITLAVTLCNDPSITFFVVNNNGRTGEGMRGKIADDKIVAKAAYVRSPAVIKEFNNGPNPSDSYIIVPCLQPPGSSGRATITVSCPSETFQLRPVASS